MQEKQVKREREIRKSMVVEEEELVTKVEVEIITEIIDFVGLYKYWDSCSSVNRDPKEDVKMRSGKTENHWYKEEVM